MRKLSERVRSLPVSAALTVDLAAKKMASEGRDVISFCVGEPDFGTPEAIRTVGSKAILSGDTRYTNAPGMPELRKAVADSMARKYGLSYLPGEIAVTTGAKFAVYAAVCALTDPGDEVLLPAPYWTSYYHLSALAGAVPSVLHTSAEDGWKLTPRKLESSLNEHTAVLILNNPNNPSGAVYSQSELAELGSVLRGTDIAVIADEIYDSCLFTDRPFAAAASVSEDMRARTITVNGVSKAYAMTGWRIGWAAGDAALIRGISALLSHTTGCPNTAAQRAAIRALNGPQEETARMAAAYRRRRDLLVQGLRGLPGISFTEPDGTFYLMPVLCEPLKSVFGNGTGFALALLEEEAVAVVPCADYGVTDAVRISFTLEESRLSEGIARLRRFVLRHLEEEKLG